MRSVRLEDSASDGERAAADDPAVGALVVRAEDGERFALVVDDALRAAVTPDAHDPDLGDPHRRDPGSNDPLSGAPGVNRTERVPARPAVTVVPLTPRDIQVRVRSGESPEDLADGSGTDLERIMRFAYPVLEERARIADEARRSRARRDGDGSLVPFGETVDRRFLTHGIDPATVSWDSFRRPDGTWVVRATWAGTSSGRGESERSAHWAFALASRTVLPVDEVGSDLLSDRPLRPVMRAVPDAGDQHEQVVDEVYDQESPAPHRRAQQRPTTSHDSLPLRLAEPPRDGRRPRAGVFGTAQDEQFGWDHASGAEPAMEQVIDSGLDDLFGTSTGQDPARADRADAAATGPKPPTRGTGRSKASREQTKIPSWDDILLGVRRKQD